MSTRILRARVQSVGGHHRIAIGKGRVIEAMGQRRAVDKANAANALQLLAFVLQFIVVCNDAFELVVELGEQRVQALQGAVGPRALGLAAPAHAHGARRYILGVKDVHDVSMSCSQISQLLM